MTTEQEIDDCVLGEMLYIACMYRDCGFTSVQTDTDTQIQLLTELVQLRERCKLNDAPAVTS